MTIDVARKLLRVVETAPPKYKNKNKQMGILKIEGIGHPLIVMS